jgi:DME family drug/metabolite transporter
VSVGGASAGTGPGSLSVVAPTQRSIISVLLACVLFGTAGTAGAMGPEGTTPLGVGAVRLIVGAAALVLVMGSLGGRPRRLLELWRSPPVVAAALSAATYQVCFFASVDTVGVGLGTLVSVGSGPIFAGLLGWAILGHRPNATWALATVVCIVGLALRSSDTLGGGEPVGLLLALAAGLASAVWTVAAKREIDRGVRPVEMATGSFALGAILLVPVLLGQPLAWLSEPSGIALALYLGVATMALANVVLGRGLAGLTPGPVATLMLTDPLVATLLGVAVLGETLDAVAWVGLLLVFAGLVLQGLSLARGQSGADERLPAPAL